MSDRPDPRDQELLDAIMRNDAEAGRILEKLILNINPPTDEEYTAWWQERRAQYEIREFLRAAADEGSN